MQNKRPWIAFIYAGATFFLPFVAYAASGLGGLVPCNGIDCQACNLVDLINSIIGFVLGLSIPIAIVLFAYAGGLYFTAAANEGNIRKAHSIFYSTIVGLLIALGAYLMVETVLHAILSKDYWEEGKWSKIQCVNRADRPTDKKVSDLIGQAINVHVNGPQASGEVTSGGAGSMRYIGTGACSEASLSAFGSAAATMSCIAQAESSCDPSEMADNNFSIGYFQVNMTANQVTCNGETIDCRKAFSAQYTGTNHNVSVINPALRDQCVALLKNPVCNTETALQIYKENGFTPWTQRTLCGVK